MDDVSQPKSESTAGADPASLTAEALEAEITTLAGHIAAATARFLALLAVFDAAGGWKQIGLRSCEQWLSWKCGLAPTTAREQLRVARRLQVLPTVRKTFAAGALSYSKVRALTRVATPATEADLVDAARNATAEQVHRLCRGLTRARSLPDAIQQQASAAFTHHWNDDGTLRFAGRLSAEDGALLLRALESQREILHGPLPEGQTRFIPTREFPADDGADPGMEAARDDPDSQPDDRFRSRAELAARSDAEALVRLAVHALDTPPGPVCGNPVRLIVHTSEEALAASGPLGHHRSGPSAEVERPADVRDQDDAAVDDAAVDDGAADDGAADERPGGSIENGGGLLAETVQRLACNAVLEPAGDPDAPTDAEVPSADRDRRRAANRRQRDALMRRDGGCRFPGCTRVRGLQAHHVTHHAHGGPTTMVNLVLLCQHHHVVLHEGGWRLEWAAPGGGTRPQGTGRQETSRRDGLRAGSLMAVGPRGQRIVEAPRTSGRADLLAAQHQRTVTPQTVTGGWAGQALNLGYAVSVFAQAGERPKASAEATAERQRPGLAQP